MWLLFQVFAHSFIFLCTLVIVVEGEKERGIVGGKKGGKRGWWVFFQQVFRNAIIPVIIPLITCASIYVKLDKIIPVVLHVHLELPIACPATTNKLKIYINDNVLRLSPPTLMSQLLSKEKSHYYISHLVRMLWLVNLMGCILNSLLKFKAVFATKLFRDLLQSVLTFIASANDFQFNNNFKLSRLLFCWNLKPF